MRNNLISVFTQGPVPGNMNMSVASPGANRGRQMWKSLDSGSSFDPKQTMSNILLVNPDFVTEQSAGKPDRTQMLPDEDVHYYSLPASSEKSPLRIRPLKKGAVLVVFLISLVVVGLISE